MSNAMKLQGLHPAQRFMYEYGCFAAFWSNFDMMMEVAIWRLTRRTPIENCREVNRLTAGQKRRILTGLLIARNESAKMEALNKVFEIAQRNDWIHGHILNPNGDFSRLTLLRVTIDGCKFAVTNKDIDLNASPFGDFFDAWAEFEACFDSIKELGNQYITELQQPLP